MVPGLPRDFNLVLTFAHHGFSRTSDHRKNLVLGCLVRTANELFLHSMKKRGEGRHHRAAIHRVLIFHFVAVPGIWFPGLDQFFKSLIRFVEGIGE